MKKIIQFEFIVYLLILILVIYVYTSKRGDTNNRRHFNETVDSLNNEIKRIILVNDSLYVSILTKNQQIIKKDSILIELGLNLKKEKEQHEKDINRINAMSNSDITRKFTDVFK
jgi:hypothetical protein